LLGDAQSVLTDAAQAGRLYSRALAPVQLIADALYRHDLPPNVVPLAI
jgi:hypothetical protein